MKPILHRMKPILYLVLYLLLLVCVIEFVLYGCKQCSYDAGNFKLLLDSTEYQDGYLDSIWGQLIHRVQVQPFNLVSLTIFVLAVIHTFFARYFNIASNRLRKKYGKDTFAVEFLRFMGEIEVIFGVWVIPLLMAMTLFYDWDAALYYINSRSYTEPLFVVVVMAIASSGPILSLVENSLRFIVRLGGEGVQSWWWALLTIGPLLGSFITEPGAMTVCALLLGRKFYEYKPSKSLAYATLGLLFVNISVGGVFTCFAAPPVLMVSRAWGWDSLYMIQHFGWKALIGIVVSNCIYFLYFRREFHDLEKTRLDSKTDESTQLNKTPIWISIVHVLFLSWIVIHAVYPVVVIGSFLLFIGFYQATLPFQKPFTLKTPIFFPRRSSCSWGITRVVDFTYFRECFGGCFDDFSYYSHCF